MLDISWTALPSSQKDDATTKEAGDVRVRPGLHYNISLRTSHESSSTMEHVNSLDGWLDKKAARNRLTFFFFLGWQLQTLQSERATFVTERISATFGAGLSQSSGLSAPVTEAIRSV